MLNPEELEALKLFEGILTNNEILFINNNNNDKNIKLYRTILMKIVKNYIIDF